MITMSLAQIAEAVGGTVHDSDGQTALTGPAFIDSRTAARGGLFVAFAGENTDGHDYTAGAVEAGAAAVLATRPTGVPSVVVSDVQKALTQLARHVARQLTDTTVIGLTGSAGKTSTKDMLAQVLGSHAATIATEGSLNNEIGLPLTVLRADNRTRYLVLEMGASHVGDIAFLTGIARPDIGMVLNVGTAHAGEFGGPEFITKAKGEMVEALPAGATAILNNDDPQVSAMTSRTKADVWTFGIKTAADISADEISVDPSGAPSFVLRTPTGQAPVTLSFLGEHQVLNALAAATTATVAGMTAHDIATALHQARPLAGHRMQIIERPDGVRLIDDTFNANPASVQAALRALAAMTAQRRIVVLGEMAELGETSAHGHAQVGESAALTNPALLVAVGGAGATAIAQAATRTNPSLDVQHLADAKSAKELLVSYLRDGDLVLFKASKVAKFDALVEAMKQEAATPA
ncbi:MAG: UDP-N-acetylmuramoyl-tripeptide--D-alanyl-D-alanine ligase [Stackebrandtia sp.]